MSVFCSWKMPACVIRYTRNDRSVLPLKYRTECCSSAILNCLDTLSMTSFSDRHIHIIWDVMCISGLKTLKLSDICNEYQVLLFWRNGGEACAPTSRATYDNVHSWFDLVRSTATGPSDGGLEIRYGIDVVSAKTSVTVYQVLLFWRNGG